MTSAWTKEKTKNRKGKTQKTYTEVRTTKAMKKQIKPNKGKQKQCRTK